MPSRAYHACGQGGCPELVSGRARCSAHTIERKKDPTQAKFYGSSQWQKLRAIVKRQQPICGMCKRAPSTSVHHKDGDWKNCTMENLEGVCKPCHARHSGTEHRMKRGNDK